MSLIERGASTQMNDTHSGLKLYPRLIKELKGSDHSGLIQNQVLEIARIAQKWSKKNIPDILQVYNSCASSNENKQSVG